MVVEKLVIGPARRAFGISNVLMAKKIRSQRLSNLSGVVALLMLTACSTTPDNFYDAGGITFSARHDKSPDPVFVEVGDRVQGVAYRLRLTSTDWCGPHVQYETGLSVWNAAVAHLFGLNPALEKPKVGPNPTVLYIAPGSTAARAGIQRGDTIERVDDVPVLQGMDGIHQLEMWRRSLALSSTSTTIRIRRDSEVLTVNLVPDRVCDFRVTLKQEDWGIGHYAPNRNVTILVQDAGGDEDELAFRVAHSAAHGLMNHAGQRKQAGIAASAADASFFLIGVPLAIASMGAYPDALATPFENAVPARMQLELEPKADLCGMYIMAAAGYDLHAVTRMSVGAVRTSFDAENVSATKVRMARVSEAARSIQELQARGLPLSPNTDQLRGLMQAVIASGKN